MKPVQEQHYTPGQLAKLWGLIVSTVWSLFERVPGVLQINRSERPHKRWYRTMRIFASVAERVHRQLATR